MLIFETVLILLLGAVVLSTLARKAGIPYPTLLALGGAIVAFVPGAPTLNLPPDLILALFVAPVLLDAAHDTSLRDLRNNWRPVMWLVVVAVGLTSVTAAFVARLFFPDLSWPAAIALGAVISPPDAVAALAVLAHVKPPHRIRKILEGESLLNDATALLIYKLAVAAAVAGTFSPAQALPTFALVVVGSVVVGWLLARLPMWQMPRIEDAPTAVILQFVMTFAVWIIAERLGLSGVVTVVVFGLVLGHRTAQPLSARIRVPSFAIWESVTMVLNILAFTLIGLQIRPTIEALEVADRWHALGAALVILGIVIAARFVWVMIYHFTMPATPEGSPRTTKGAVVVAWSGMRGIVTLAAAMALPQDFPHRDFVLLTAFVVVLGTLVIQGLTLRPLLLLLKLPKDETIDQEIGVAREAALQAAIQELQGEEGPAAARLREEYADALDRVRRGERPQELPENALRQRMLSKARDAIQELRSRSVIGDDAYRRVEEELDWLELSAQSSQSSR